MNFDPLRILRSVVEFYISSGIVEPDSSLVNIASVQLPLLTADNQKYEQINLFIFGHLLPAFIPLGLSLEFIPSKSMLRTYFSLPSASASAYHNLFDELSMDSRMEKLNILCGAKLKTQLEPARLVMDFPVSLPTKNLALEPIDIDELKQRFDTLEIANTLVAGYISNGKRHLLLLEKAVDVHDHNEAFRNIHALKGGAMNICAPELIQKCKELELMIKNEETQLQAVKIRELADYFKKLEQYYEANKELFHG